MPRPKNTIPSVAVSIALPQDLAQKVEVLLFSELEGRVPHGKKSEFFTQLVREYFRTQAAADLAQGDVDGQGR